MRAAQESFPKMHAMVYRSPDAGPIKTKSAANKAISEYLRKSKTISKLIIHFLYGPPGSKSKHAVKKRDKLLSEADILGSKEFKLFRIVEDWVWSEAGDVVESTARRVIYNMTKMDDHFKLSVPDDPGDAEEDTMMILIKAGTRWMYSGFVC